MSAIVVFRGRGRWPKGKLLGGKCAVTTRPRGQLHQLLNMLLTSRMTVVIGVASYGGMCPLLSIMFFFCPTLELCEV